MKAISAVAVLGILMTGAAWAQDGGYLEIPLKGKLGEEITTSGLEKALQSAHSAGIKNIVFNVDSTGGDQLVCKDIANVLIKADREFKFTAVVTQATGLAVVFIVRADRIFVRPGAQIGGAKLSTAKIEQEAGVTADVILSNIALNAGVQAKERGRSPELIRAMIDPGEAVYAWKGANGKAEFGRRLPPDVAKENVLLEHKGGKLLTLSAEQLVALNYATAFDGPIDALGKELGIAGWSAKGNALATMTQAATTEKAAEDTKKTDRQAFLIDQNKKRREATKAGIERFLDLSHEWNPKLGTYSTQKEWSGYWDGANSTDTGRLTPEARRKWQDRTDITVSALSKAIAGIVEMKKLEKEAKNLGQELMYPEGKLEIMYEDLNLTMTMIERERDKRFKDDK
jgi:ATP-dependent protease ClpP protease subunit